MTDNIIQIPGGLYNGIFGMNPDAERLLAILDLTPAHFGRFRDAYVANGEIVVYTRCGGRNREIHRAVFRALEEHPNYLRDVDDAFDSTYCTFYFRIPAEIHELLAPLDIGEWDPSARWKQKLEDLEAGRAEPSPALNDVMIAIAEKLKLR